MEATGTWSSVLYSMAVFDVTAALAAIFVLMPMRKRMAEAGHQGNGSVIDPKALAHEIADTYARRVLTTAPTTREGGGLDLATAYAVEHELVHLRQAEGHRSVGRKVGFANKDIWRVLKLETLAWAHMYDDTVRRRGRNSRSVDWTPGARRRSSLRSCSA